MIYEQLVPENKLAIANLLASRRPASDRRSGFPKGKASFSNPKETRQFTLAAASMWTDLRREGDSQ